MAPFSGAFNTVFILLAAFLTLIFPVVYRLFDMMSAETQALQKTKRKLEEANRQLQELSRQLEEKVKERTQELAISEEKFRKLFEASGDAIFFCDAEGRLRDINPSGLKLLGFSKEEIVGRSLGDFFLRKEDWKHYKKQLCSVGWINNYETELVIRGGEKRYVIITANAIEYVKGCRLGCQGIIKDITSFKEMMDRLIHSEKMAAVGQLAAGIAHEINTPLGIIYGYTQLLKENWPESEVIEDLEIIEKQVQSCRRLISDLLLFARSSKFSERHRFSLNELLEQIIGMVYYTFEKAGIRISFHPGDIPEIEGNEERLREVVMNLLTNSRDALKEGGEIHIWTALSPEGKVVLEVGDTGCGIPSEIRDRIFEPFFTTKPPGKGTGLGLSVSYAIIKEHGGEIEVFSPPPSKEPYLSLNICTLFRITLPERSHA
ncbi:two-component system sensor histidine kinase NtrB [Thermosulfurimonas dismutans]|uniref:histidine kinase n=1 Tax=Thermosulfurimonas dismutans TaxID=999894 RepID=A0A179D5W5_9BACT|nr:ATP-binding protein [Thermosulfurimonas dismutans]OAQ21436.1 sensor histidine kinase [Thermosulfurimonas dismutans]